MALQRFSHHIFLECISSSARYQSDFKRYLPSLGFQMRPTDGAICSDFTDFLHVYAVLCFKKRMLRENYTQSLQISSEWTIFPIKHRHPLQRRANYRFFCVSKHVQPLLNEKHADIFPSVSHIEKSLSELSVEWLSLFCRRGNGIRHEFEQALVSLLKFSLSLFVEPVTHNNTQNRYFQS